MPKFIRNLRAVRGKVPRDWLATSSYLSEAIILIVLGLDQGNVVSEGLGRIRGETNLGVPLIVHVAPAETGDVVIVIEP